LFYIDRTKNNQGNLRYQADVHKIARNNVQFLQSITMYGQMSANNSVSGYKAKNNNYIMERRKNRKNLLFSKSKFKQRFRYAIGVPRRNKHVRSYSELQKNLKRKEDKFKQKKNEYYQRGLRVLDKQEIKVLSNKYGRNRVYNAGLSKMQKKKTKTSGRI